MASMSRRFLLALHSRNQNTVAKGDGMHVEAGTEKLSQKAPADKFPPTLLMGKHAPGRVCLLISSSDNHHTELLTHQRRMLTQPAILLRYNTTCAAATRRLTQF